MRQNKIITRFSILLGMLFFWGNSFAQISVSINQQTIKQIIPQIEKTSGYNVFYTDKLPNLDTRKDLHVSNAPLEAILKELFKGTKITFEIKPTSRFYYSNKPTSLQAIGNKYPASYWWKQKALTERGMGSRPTIHGPHGFTLSDGSWNGSPG